MKFKHALATSFIALALFALAGAANANPDSGNSFSVNSVQILARAPFEARAGDVIPIQVTMRNINAVDAMGRLELLDGDNAAVDYVNVLLKGNSQSTAVFEINLSKIASKNPVFTSRLKVGGNSIESKAVVLVSEENVLLQVFGDWNTPVNDGREFIGIENIRVRVSTLNKTLVRLVVVKGGNAIIFQKNVLEGEYSASIALGESGEYEVLAGEIAGDKIIAGKSIKFSTAVLQADEVKAVNDWNAVLGLGALVFLIVIFILFKKHEGENSFKQAD